MPKRPETPEISTGTHLITIWNPYPADIRIVPGKGLHREDCEKLTRWLSCIVGMDNVLSLYWKPKSKDTIIVELAEFNQHKGRVLGEHKWINVFKDIAVEDKGRSSKLYLCPLGNYVELEKQRWKETPVDVDWFKGWNPTKNRMVNMPYPKSTWCPLPDHVDIDEFCSKIPVSLFPEEEAKRNKAMEPPMSPRKLAAHTTPGTSVWSATSGPNPSQKPRPELHASSVPQAKRGIERNYRKVETMSMEQSMRAILGPPNPKPPQGLKLDDNGLPSLEPEDFDWFEETENADGADGWKAQATPDWEFKQMSLDGSKSPGTDVSSNNRWNVGPSWGDSEDDEPAAPAASSSKAPAKQAPAAQSKPQAWKKQSQPATNAWGPKSPSSSGGGGSSGMPSPAPSSRASDDWSTAAKGKGKATQKSSGDAGRGRGGARGQQKARP